MNHTNHTTRATPTGHTPRITLEMALWILVAIVALALRLPHLGAAPLNTTEAHEAMLAWSAATGQGMPETDYSPLLFAANGLLFAICGASDVLARLWPALFGAVLALTPFLLRRRIGRLGALAAGLYLAISPTSLVASRQLDGAVLAAVGGMLLLGGWVYFFDTSKRHWLTLSAGGLALAVTSSSFAYGFLLTLGLAWLIISWIWPDDGHILRSPALHAKRQRGASVTSHVSRCFLVFISIALALATGLGWNLAGIGAVGGLLAAWFSRLGPASISAVSPLTLVIVYEPLALLFGLGGLLWAVRRGRRFAALLGLWAALGILLLALMPGRAPLDVLWVVLPLALLAGVALETLLRGLWERREWLNLNEGLYVPVVLILWIHFFLMLARYATLGAFADLALAFLSLFLQALLGLSFALAIDISAALRGVAMGTGIAFLAFTLSTGWGVAHLRPADPRELLIQQPTAAGVRDLAQTLRDLSWRETGIPTTLPFTFEVAHNAVLAWYLRDFSAARQVENLGHRSVGADATTGGLDAEENVPVLVTLGRDMALSDVEYVGQDFALRRGWDRREISCAWEWPPRCHTAVGWLLFRKTPSQLVAEEWGTLWLAEDWIAE